MKRSHNEVDRTLETIESSSKIRNVTDNLSAVKFLFFSCILAPSWDVYSDWALTVEFILQDDPLYAVSMLTPQLLNICFTMILWKKIEKQSLKSWSWMLVVGQCWPQFVAARIIWMITKGLKWFVFKVNRNIQFRWSTMEERKREVWSFDSNSWTLHWKFTLFPCHDCDLDNWDKNP